MSDRIPQAIGELVEELADLIRMADAAEAEGRDLTAKLYRRTASIIATAIAERASE